ncbi:hypothetical protein [Sporolactobacillus laevolacticus]|uniref:nSTAND3 domain-containing NTPase n=1 Tax=Sporolactobacillus laevolacticus TaxID=33018 RepID=UPI0025B53011|nr:hypothetical protein [Sporolactobacillus laevolacticus]MDN3955955.1 hypothetical protein [Sporolactobacillus laevolacticus]
MANYDFHKLMEPMQFQKFSRDIIQIRDDLSFESYKEGKDQGIDGGSFHNNHTIILQAKRRKCEFRRLIRDLKNYEKEKVQKLNPDRYILVLSMDLSKKDKDEIVQLFSPYIKNTVDIVTQEDLNNLLGQKKYHSIEKKYCELWLPSTNVLETMLKSVHHGILLQESVREFEESLRKSEVFVETCVYNKALKKLKEKNAIIISGEPGIGKTTIAYQLGKHFILRKGYKNFYWVKSVDDIYIAQRDFEKKVIIFDDFWGSIFQESSLAGRDEQRLAKILERIKFDKDCILILTTREYVLRQGLEKHADLNEVVEKFKLECRLDEYSDIEKVKIFFGHLKRGNLSWLQTRELFREHNNIVKHVNYNPRVIEMFLQNVELEEDPNECVEHFWNYLEQPENFWKAIFNNLSTEAKLLAVIIAISPKPSQRDHVERTYYRCLEQLQPVIEKKNFKESFEELEKTIIKSIGSKDESTIIIKFQNPSAFEYIVSNLREHINQYFDILMHGCCYYDQLLDLLGHYKSNLSEEKYIKLMKKCIDNFEIMPSISEDYSEYLDDNEWDYFDTFEDNTKLLNFYKLLCCYEKDILPEYETFFEKFVINFNEQLKNLSLEIDNYDLEILYFLVIRECVKNGMALNGLNIISIYYKRICSENRSLDIDDFKKVFPDEYSIFLEKYQQSIQYYIEEYYECELDYYTEINDVIHCKHLYDAIPKQLNKYDLPYTYKFKSIVEEYMSYLDDVEAEKERQDVKQEKEVQTEPELAYNEIVDIFEKEILGEESYFWEEDLKEYILRSDINENLKNELMEIQKRVDCWYIREFLKDEQSYLFLEKNLLETGAIFRSAKMFIVQLLAGITLKSGIEQKKIVGFLIELCPDIMYRENSFLTKEEIMSTEAYLFNFENKGKYLDKMVKAGLFIKQGKWYQLINVLMVMLPYGLAISDMKKEEKIDYYHSMDITDEWPKMRIRKKRDCRVLDDTYTADIGFYYFENIEWEKLFFKLFLELDSAVYVEYYVSPMLQPLLNRVKNKDILESVAIIMEDLSFVLYVDKFGENTGATATTSLVWSLIEALDMGNVFDLLPEKFSEMQMKYIADHFEIVREDGRDLYCFKFAQLGNSTELISKLELHKSVRQVYKQITDTLERMLKENVSL